MKKIALLVLLAGIITYFIMMWIGRYKLRSEFERIQVIIVNERGDVVNMSIPDSDFSYKCVKADDNEIRKYYGFESKINPNKITGNIAMHIPKNSNNDSLIYDVLIKEKLIDRLKVVYGNFDSEGVGQIDTIVGSQTKQIKNYKYKIEIQI